MKKAMIYIATLGVALAAGTGCERAETITVPAASVVQVPANVGLDRVLSVATKDGALLLAGEGSDEQPMVVVFDPDTGDQIASRSFDGTTWCGVVSGCDAVLVIDAQGQLFLASPSSDEPLIATPVRFDGDMPEVISAADLLVFASDAMAVGASESQLAAIERSTGAVAAAVDGRPAIRTLSRSGDEICVAPRRPRPEDSAYLLDCASPAPSLQPVALEPCETCGVVVGWSKELGFIWGNLPGPGGSRLRSVTVGDRRITLASGLLLGRSHAVIGHYLLYDATGNSVAVVNPRDGKKWRVSLGAWNGEQPPSLRLAHDGDHAIVFSRDEILRLSLRGDAPTVADLE